jgi:hypothetical protein
MPEDGDKADDDKIDLGIYGADEIQAILEQINYKVIVIPSGCVSSQHPEEWYRHPPCRHPPIAALSNVNHGSDK